MSYMKFINPQFLESTWPIIVAHVAFPPLSYFVGERIDGLLGDVFDFLYSLWPRQQLNLNFINSLLLKDNDKADDIRRLTYMFIHADYKHLFSNLYGYFWNAHTAWNCLGCFGMNALFVAGGVAASFQNRFIKNKKSETLIETLADRLFMGNSIANGIKSFFVTRTCGSSGGVLSLMGFNEVIRVKSLIDLMRKKTRIEADECLEMLIGFIGSAAYIANEWKLMKCDAVDSTKLINHAAHIQGFFFGASVGVVYLFFQSQNDHSRESSTKKTRYRDSTSI